MIKKLLIGLGIVIGIFILIGIIAIVTSPAETTEPVSPPTTEEALPEKPPLTSAEQAYATTIADQATTVGNAFTELGGLLQNPQIGNEDWTIKMATQLAIVRTTYNKAMEMAPPDSMTHIHSKYTRAMKHYNTATELIAQGIDEMKTYLLERATAEIQIGTQLINEATELVTEFTIAHSQ